MKTEQAAKLKKGTIIRFCYSQDWDFIARVVRYDPWNGLSVIGISGVADGKPVLKDQTARVSPISAYDYIEIKKMPPSPEKETIIAKNNQKITVEIRKCQS